MWLGWGRQIIRTDIWCGNLLEIVHLVDQEEYGRLNLRELECGYGRWMELAQGRVQWRALVLAMLNLRVLLQQIWLVRS